MSNTTVNPNDKSDVSISVELPLHISFKDSSLIWEVYFVQSVYEYHGHTTSQEFQLRINWLKNPRFMKKFSCSD